MRSGTLKYVIDIHEPRTDKDQYGATSTNWFHIITTRADVIIDSGDKIIEAQEIISDYSVTFVVRGYHKINETMRITWNGRKYDIVSILPDVYLQKLNISCRLVNE